MNGIRSLAETLNNLSKEQVIIRVRQWPRHSGNGCRNDLRPGGKRESYRSYTETTQAHLLVRYRQSNKYPSPLIHLMYEYDGHNPISSPNSKFNHNLFLEEDNVSRGWLIICDNWIQLAPPWMSEKPVLFCRQYNPDEEYGVVPTSDLVILRHLNKICVQIKEVRNNLYCEAQKLEGLKEEQESCRIAGDLLLNGLRLRLARFVQDQYGTLVANLGIPLVDTKDRYL